MNRKYLNVIKLICAPLLVAALLIAAGCGGNKPKETPANTNTEAPVDTAESPTESPAATETMTEETPTSLTGDFKRRTTRDPFIPVVGTPAPSPTARINIETPQPDITTPEILTPEATTPGPINVQPTQPSVTEVSDIGVSVTGIMKVSGGYQAILKSTSTKRSYLVRQGQKVGDWKVTSISKRLVVLKAPGYVAKLRLEEDVVSPGSVKPGAPKDEGPKLPSG